VRKANNLTTILGHCHVIWEPELPGTLWAPRASNGTDLPFNFTEKCIGAHVPRLNRRITASFKGHSNIEDMKTKMQMKTLDFVKGV